MMHSWTRIRTLAAPLAASACLLVAGPAMAHMPWLASDPQGHVLLWFGESPADRTYHLPDSVASIELTPAGQEKALKMVPVDTDDLVGLRSRKAYQGDQEIAGSVDYGLYHGMKLTYHVEHLPAGSSSDWPGEPREDATLQTVIQPSGKGGVVVTVLRQGKPLSDTSVKLLGGDGEQAAEGTTDGAGLVTFTKSQLKPGLNAVLVGVTDKQASGTYDGERYSSTADYLTASFHMSRPDSKPDDQAPSGPHVDPSSQVSVVASGLPELPEELTSFGAAIAGDTLYVYGGHTGNAHSYSISEQSNRLWSLDLDADDARWQKRASGPRLQGLALVPWNDSVVRIGGFTAANKEGEDHDLRSQASVALYDPDTEKWGSLPDLPEPRSSLDAAVLGDHVYVFGGWHLAGDSDVSQWHQTAWKLDLNDPQAGWQALAEPPFQRRALSVAAFDGKLYVIGGMRPEGGPTTRVDVYDPASDRWSKAPALPGRGMSGFGSAAFAAGDRLYVSTMDGFVHRLAEDGQSWTTVAKTDPARFFHRMLPAEGVLLMVGGANMEIGKFTHIDEIRLDES